MSLHSHDRYFEVSREHLLERLELIRQGLAQAAHLTEALEAEHEQVAAEIGERQ